MGLNKPMPFGKFKGITIKQLCDTKRGSYVHWLLENMESFELNDEAQLYFETHFTPKPEDD